MNKRYIQYSLLFAFFILALIFLLHHKSLLFNTSFVDIPNDYTAKNGFMDLSNHDFLGPISLEGNWLFFQKSHICTNTNTESKPINKKVPGWWSSTFPGLGFGTYQLTVKLPDSIVNSELKIYLDHFLSAYKIFLYDGSKLHFLGGGGVSSANKLHSKDSPWDHTIEKIVPKRNEIKIYVEASNYTYDNGGFHIAPILARSQTIDQLIKHRDYIVLLVVGTLLSCLLFNMSQVIFYRNENGPLWLIILCIMALFNFLHRLYPFVFPHEIETKLFLLSFHIVFFCYFRFFCQTIFNKGMNEKSKFIAMMNLLKHFSSLLLYAFVVCVIFFPATYTIRFATWFRTIPLFMLLFIVLSIGWLLLKKNKNKELYVEISIQLLSFLSMATAVIISLFYHANKKYSADSPQFILQSVALISIILMQSLIVFYKTSILRKKAESDHRRLKKVIQDNAILTSISNTKNDFIASMNHELRTPLNHIVGYSEMLNRESQSAIHQKYAQKILVQSNWLVQLINSIIDISRIENNTFKLSNNWFLLSKFFIDLNDFFIDQIKIKELYFKINLPKDTDITLFYADDIRLRQILINIITNAIKNTNYGGITIIVNKSYKEGLFISIQDTGVGISVEEQKMIFTPFHSSNKKSSCGIAGGIGLGLTICKELISAMNGEISFKSIENKGTTFNIKLPNVKFKEASPLEVLNMKNQKSINMVPNYHVLPDKSYKYDDDLKKLLKEKLSNWDYIKERRNFKEIHQFAEEIKQIGIESKIKPIEIYGDALATSVVTYDVDSINKIMAKFPDIVNNK